MKSPKVVKSQPSRRGKGWPSRATVLALVAAAAVLFLVSPVSLAKDKRAKKAQEKPRNPQQRRFDAMPTMQFIRGVLSRDHLGNWQLNEKPLYFGPRSVIMDQARQGETVLPREGDTVLLMGYRSGGAFVVVRGTRFPAIPFAGTSDDTKDGRIQRSLVDPTVGWGEPFE
jgi:hypothetical protein